MTRWQTPGAACAAALLAISAAAAAGEAARMDRRGKQWVPIEWSLANPGHRGDPFDLVASATFTHDGSGEKVTTGMFHAGAGTWRFRFTPSRAGRWTFTTASDAKALAGRRGTVTAAANRGARGFVTAFGSKWGFGGTGEVFVPQLVMYANPDAYHNRPDKIDRDIRTFLVEHGFNGFHTLVFCRWFDIHQERATGIRGKDPDPDPRTFEALELLIRKTYAAGGIVHIWAWGGRVAAADAGEPGRQERPGRPAAPALRGGPPRAPARLDDGLRLRPGRMDAPGRPPRMAYEYA